MGWMEFYPGDYLIPSSYTCPVIIKQKLAEKRRLGKNGTVLNRATQDLKQFLHQHKNSNIQRFLHGLTLMASTDSSLWKTTKKLKTVTQPSIPIRTSQGTWVRSNAEKAQSRPSIFT
jgi:hypothetical protein